jgi:hypothetical protein
MAQEKTRTVSPKEWLSITLSILAFVISAWSAYWNIIRQVDDVRVVIEGIPLIQIDPAKATIRVIANQRMSFTNLGNRPAAVTSISLSISQPNENSTQEVCTGTAVTEPFDVEPLVVKAGEISVLHTKLRKGAFVVNLEVANRGKKTVLVEACAIFYVVTPDNETATAALQLDRATIIAGDYYEQLMEQRHTRKIIFRRWSTVFK